LKPWEEPEEEAAKWTFAERVQVRFLYNAAAQLGTLLT
jgi:hypothetical protein